MIIEDSRPINIKDKYGKKYYGNLKTGRLLFVLNIKNISAKEGLYGPDIINSMYSKEVTKLLGIVANASSQNHDTLYRYSPSPKDMEL